MAAAYRLTNSTAIIRTSDGAYISDDTNNRDYSAYLKWVVDGGVADPYVALPHYAGDALTALAESDTTIIRCYEHGVSVPYEWQTYRAVLRAIVSSNTGPLPNRPAYPAGT
jgi:hypothetical protein